MFVCLSFIIFPGEEKCCSRESGTTTLSPPEEEVTDAKMRLPSGTRHSQLFIPTAYTFPNHRSWTPAPSPAPFGPSAPAFVGYTQVSRLVPRVLGTQVSRLCPQGPCQRWTPPCAPPASSVKSLAEPWQFSHGDAGFRGRTTSPAEPVSPVAKRHLFCLIGV